MPWSSKARASLVGLALASSAGASSALAQLSASTSVPLPPEAGTPAGPAATSGMGQPRYDEVGLARMLSPDVAGAPGESGGTADAAAIVAAHHQLPPGSVAEITPLDTGTTILVLIDRTMVRAGDRAEVELSPGAAGLLGLGDKLSMPVRVRGVVASAADLLALKAGRPAGKRLDAPPAVLAALRKQLELASAAPSIPSPAPHSAVPAIPSGAAKTAVAARPATPAPRSVTSGKYLVQVAALSSQGRARALAETLGGYVEGTGGLHRVRLGPFADENSAQRARDAAERRGYGGAAIIVQP